MIHSLEKPSPKTLLNDTHIGSTKEPSDDTLRVIGNINKLLNNTLIGSTKEPPDDTLIGNTKKKKKNPHIYLLEVWYQRTS